jgi:hypothetical protein
MSIRTAALAAVAAGAAIAATSGAEAAITNPEQLYNGFNMNELIAVASELGYQSEVQTLSDGTVILKIATPDVIFAVQRTVCDATTCSGLLLYGVFTPNFDVPMETVNQYNSNQSIVTTYKLDDAVVVTRYLIADYGTPKGNVASNFFNFNKRADEFATFAQSGANTISAKIESNAPAPDVGAEKAPVSFAVELAHGEKLDLPVKELIQAGVATPLKK